MLDTGLVCTVVKSKGKISQNIAAFSEYMNYYKLKIPVFTNWHPLFEGDYVDEDEEEEELEDLGLSPEAIEQALGTFICPLDELTWVQLLDNPWLFLAFILDQNWEQSLLWMYVIYTVFRSK